MVTDDPTTTNPDHYRTLWETELPSGQAVWLPAQRHSGANTGDTPTHTIFVELKGAAAGEMTGEALGPAERH